MSYVNELESDFSVFHRLDIWSVSFSLLIRLAPRLPAYQGALRLAMERDAAHTEAHRSTVSPSTGLPQVVDSTPDHEVAAMWQQALAQKYHGMGVQVSGFEQVDDSTMERLVNSG